MLWASSGRERLREARLARSDCCNPPTQRMRGPAPAPGPPSLPVAARPPRKSPALSIPRCRDQKDRGWKCRPGWTPAWTVASPETHTPSIPHGPPKRRCCRLQNRRAAARSDSARWREPRATSSRGPQACCPSSRTALRAQPRPGRRGRRASEASKSSARPCPTTLPPPKSSPSTRAASRLCLSSARRPPRRAVPAASSLPHNQSRRCRHPLSAAKVNPGSDLGCRSHRIF